MGPQPQALVAPHQVDRRQHPRYLLQERLLIRRKDGSSYPATICEISVAGLSASTTAVLRPGENVQLSPVVGEQLGAIVRRRVGNVYGFEFVSVSSKLREDLHILCEGLVPFRNLDHA
jgi:hypothetical protein